MFTEKERLILKALLEEELDAILSNARERDDLFSKYLFSLTRILSKIDVDEAEDSSAQRFYLLNRALSAETIA
jgi:hypothetical protein